MPGLCGIIGPSLATRAHVNRMVAHQRRYDWHVGVIETFDGGAFGHVRVERAGAYAGRAVARFGHLSIVFDGELYEPAHMAGTTDAERVLAGVEAEGQAFLRRVHGCFTCAIWDAQERTLTLANDRFGMRPLFWAHERGRLAFASEVGALVSGGVSDAPSSRGLAELFAFGQFLGDSTLYEEAHAAPAAAWITYDARSDRVAISRYETCPDSAEQRSDADWLDEIDAAFAASVSQSCTDAGTLGLSLSGGLDARAILGVAPAGLPIHCVSLGVPGSIDLRAAAEMAHLTGQPFHPHHLDADFLARFEPLLSETVRLTDGHYLDQGIVLTTLPGYRDLGITTLLRGHAGELMHMSKAYAFSMDEGATKLSSKAALADWLWRRLTDYMLGSLDEASFSGSLATSLRDEARSSLERQLAAWDNVEPATQRIWRLFVHERLRRETAMSLQMFRSFVEVRLPYLEPRLVSALLAAPVHLKVGAAIQSHILRRRRPEFLRIVNANTGAPMRAGESRARLATLRMKVLARLGVKGYQPYERLGLWLATDLQPLLRRALLARPCTDGPFESPAVERLLAQHASRERNHTFLLMALLIRSMAAGGVRPTELQPA